MNNEQLKRVGWVVLIAAVGLSLLLGVTNRAAPAPVATLEPPRLLLESQAVGALRADTIFANTLLDSQGAAQVSGTLTVNSLVITSSLTNAGDVSARNITATGTISTVKGAAFGPTSLTSLTTGGDIHAANVIASGYVTSTGGFMINGSIFTMTDPITVGGVITNVRLLYTAEP